MAGAYPSTKKPGLKQSRAHPTLGPQSNMRDRSEDPLASVVRVGIHPVRQLSLRLQALLEMGVCFCFRNKGLMSDLPCDQE